MNPEYSTVETDLYNPCDRGSRLGILAEELTALPEGIDGLHFHALCESRPDDLRNTLAAVEERFGKFFPQIKWLNMGGGHLMTHKDYDEDELIRILNEFQARYPHLRLILEPGSAFTWDTGCLVATVEDKVCHGGVNTLMLNVSFACHMPDCLEMPYKPVILGTHEPEAGEKRWRMGFRWWARTGSRREDCFPRYDPLHDGQDDDVQWRNASFHRYLESADGFPFSPPVWL